jgi:polysaccharide pyruvyl transferase WcaK-like protein
MTKKIVIWGAWYGSRNVGDQLLLLAITDILYQHLTKDVQFHVLTNNAPWINEYTSAESPADITALQSRKEIFKVIQTIKSCDMFIIGGGVPFFEQPAHVFVMLFLISLVRFFRKPYLLWSVSSQVVQSKFALAAFKWVLKGTDGITFRDKATRDLFAACGVQSDRMRQVADSGFALNIADDKEGIEILKQFGWTPNSRPLVALTPRKLRTADGEAETHYAIKSSQQYQQEIDCFAAAQDWLWQNGYQPIFIPMNTVPPDSDLEAARAVIAKAEYGQHALVVDQSLRPRVVPGIYRQCQASFVARVHGSITSMLGNCPMMMYAFAPKHGGIMDLMGMSDYSLASEMANPEATIKILARLLENRENLQQKMLMRLGELQTDALYPVELSRQMLNELHR